MTDHSVVHSSFTLERRYPVPVARVFAAFADPEKKARWFAGGVDWASIERSCDFREGGQEVAAGRWKSGATTRFDAHYLDIRPDARIVYSYVMHLNDRRISVSLATVEFHADADAAGTRLVVTEQGAFLDGYDDNGAREHGTSLLLDLLGASLAA